MPTVLVTYPCAVLHDPALSVIPVRRINEPRDRPLVNNPSPFDHGVQVADSLTTRARHFAGFSTQCREFRHGPRTESGWTKGRFDRSTNHLG
jgi:hypothetical protein